MRIMIERSRSKQKYAVTWGYEFWLHLYLHLCHLIISYLHHSSFIIHHHHLIVSIYPSSNAHLALSHVQRRKERKLKLSKCCNFTSIPLKVYLFWLIQNNLIHKTNSNAIEFITTFPHVNKESQTQTNAIPVNHVDLNTKTENNN